MFDFIALFLLSIRNKIDQRVDEVKTCWQKVDFFPQKTRTQQLNSTSRSLFSAKSKTFRSNIAQQYDTFMNWYSGYEYQITELYVIWWNVNFQKEKFNQGSNHVHQRYSFMCSSKLLMQLMDNNFPCFCSA